MTAVPGALLYARAMIMLTLAVMVYRPLPGRSVTGGYP
jgi:hypothetical protein